MGVITILRPKRSVFTGSNDHSFCLSQCRQRQCTDSAELWAPHTHGFTLTRTGSIWICVWNILGKCKGLNGFIVVQFPLIHFTVPSCKTQSPLLSTMNHFHSMTIFGYTRSFQSVSDICHM